MCCIAATAYLFSALGGLTTYRQAATNAGTVSFPVSITMPSGVDAVARMLLWLTEEERAGFEKELGDLLDKYGNGDQHRPDVDANRFTLLFALYSPVDQTNKRK